MIVNIRGTGGSGKSTLVRAVMDRYHRKTPKFIDGRKQPYGYVLEWDSTGLRPPLWVVGHYETACGGGDTLKSPGDVFDSVRDHAEGLPGHDVLFEGIISQDDVTRTIALHRSFPLLVLALTTPIDECLKGIQARRDERGDDRPLSPKNTESRNRRLMTSILPRLKDAGVEVMKLSREEALQETLKRLRLI